MPLAFAFSLTVDCVAQPYLFLQTSNLNIANTLSPFNIT